MTAGEVCSKDVIIVVVISMNVDDKRRRMHLFKCLFPLTAIPDIRMNVWLKLFRLNTIQMRILSLTSVLERKVVLCRRQMCSSNPYHLNWISEPLICPHYQRWILDERIFWISDNTSFLRIHFLFKWLLYEPFFVIFDFNLLGDCRM